MFPDNVSKRISSIIRNDWLKLWEKVYEIQDNAIKNTNNEVEYFREFFNNLKDYFESQPIARLSVECQTKEIHQKPKVKFGKGKNPELGDYFINVKYYDNRKLLGKKFIIYQFKIADKTKPRWKIDQIQLELLRDWPEFQLGKKSMGYNSFILIPKTKEFGSYWLSQRTAESHFWGLDIVSSAMDISLFQNKNHIENLIPLLIYPNSGTTALILQLMWFYGEFVERNTKIDDFIETLYRYVGFAPDPPNEFDEFSTESNDETAFWGIEIIVRLKK